VTSSSFSETDSADERPSRGRERPDEACRLPHADEAPHHVYPLFSRSPEERLPVRAVVGVRRRRYVCSHFLRVVSFRYVKLSRLVPHQWFACEATVRGLHHFTTSEKANRYPSHGKPAIAPLMISSSPTPPFSPAIDFTDLP